MHYYSCRDKRRQGELVKYFLCAVENKDSSSEIDCAWYIYRKVYLTIRLLKYLFILRLTECLANKSI